MYTPAVHKARKPQVQGGFDIYAHIVNEKTFFGPKRKFFEQGVKNLPVRF
jgi:hypothetical protein